MKNKLNELIYTISRYTEIALSAIMLVVIIVLIIPMIYNFISIPLLSIKASQFTEFLGNILTLIIGGICKDAGKTYGGKPAGGAHVCHCQTDDRGTSQHDRYFDRNHIHSYHLLHPQISAAQNY